MNKIKWVEDKPLSFVEPAPSLFQDSLILSKELAKRNIHCENEIRAFLDPAYYSQTSPFTFPEMDKAITRILNAAHENELIGIWGDFDVDGQTSTAVLLDGLTRMGAKVIYHIPVRKIESHGMQLSAFKTFLKQKPSLIITCDTGISELNTIKFAHSIGVDVIVTDHHTLPNTLPDAFAIVNPHQLPNEHPLSYLAGVGTSFQLIRALEQRNALPFDSACMHDLVALGTIADLAPLRSENRFYAQMGLKLMNSKIRPAFAAMFEISQASTSHITESTIGFNIAPRLNSSGRLSDANENVKFLLSEQPSYCLEFAKKLEQFNIERKAAVDSITQKADRKIEDTPSLIDEPALVLSDQGWNPGVLGIAAGRLAEKFNKPVILLNINGEAASGSVRSIRGIDITAAIRENDKCLTRYGGHAMAAGLSLPVNNIDIFSSDLMKSVKMQSDNLPQEKELIIDHVIRINEVGDQLLNELEQLSPFGQENPSLIFMSKNLEILSTNPLGTSGKHTRIIVQDVAGNTSSLINWNSNFQPIPCDRIDIAFAIQPNDFRGKSSFYLKYIDHREYDPDSISLAQSAYAIEVEDFRQADNQLLLVKEISLKEPNIQIWYEGLQEPAGIKVQDRNHLRQVKDLVILAAPQSIMVLNQILEISKAEHVTFFNIHNHEESMKEFLSSLGGAIKYYQKKSGVEATLEGLGMQLGQTEETILNGLLWFKERGNINFSYNPQGKIVFQDINNSIKTTRIPQVEQNLNKSLKETAAFRKYYERVDVNLLLRRKNPLGD
jgi:single-stranded-DNA-specific exonuclease